MLEEILKSINSNLERIANAIEGDTRSTVKMNGTEIDCTVATSLKNGPAPEVTLASQSVLPNLATSESVTVSTPVQAIPVSPVTESFTREQLAVAMSKAVSAGKMALIQSILKEFGVQALTELNPTEYNNLAAKLKASGVEV